MSGLINTSKLNNPPEEHELNVANYFSALGYDIEFIPPSNIPNFHAPDIIMDGIDVSRAVVTAVLLSLPSERSFLYLVVIKIA